MNKIMLVLSPAYKTQFKIIQYAWQNWIICNRLYSESSHRQDEVQKPKPSEDDSVKKTVSPRMAKFKEKLKRGVTPIRELEEHTVHPYAEKEPLEPWPNNTNPNTGEIGGPKGPEPTRYGDWERKGRVSDF